MAAGTRTAQCTQRDPDLPAHEPGPGRLPPTAGNIPRSHLSRGRLIFLRNRLPAREFSLLKALAGHPGQVLSRQELLSLAWDMNFDPVTNLVEGYVGYLRRKLGETVIDTVRRQVTVYRPTARNPARNELNPRVRFGHRRLLFRCVIQGHGDQAGWRALGGSRSSRRCRT
jgi:hypothetical protein